MKLTGTAAIVYAEQHNLTLGKYADPTEDAREGLTPEEASGIALDDPSLIYLLVDERMRHRESEAEYQQRPAYQDGSRVGTGDKTAGTRGIDIRLGKEELNALIVARGFSGSGSIRAWQQGYTRAFYPRPVASAADTLNTSYENALDRHYSDPAGENE